MKTFIKATILLLFLSVASVMAQGKGEASLCTDGNRYYRQAEYPKAMVCYERALKMDPLNSDIQHNIEVTRNKTIDRMPPEGTIFFVEWYKGLVMWQTIDHWAWTAVISLAIALLCFLAYLFMDSIMIRRVAFYVSCLTFLLFLFGNLFAWNRKYLLNKHDSAIIMAEQSSVKTSPTPKASDACIIHEGTYVRITDTEMKGWYGIRLSDGREGWVPAKDLEVI